MARLKNPVSTRFDDALSYASRAHATQSRKGSQIPYIAHLLAVASIVMEAGGTEDEAIAALLHDAAEDQGGIETLDDIRRRFGDDVAGIVEHCSDTFETPKPPWEKRKRDYAERLGHADASTLLVSIADKVHNARSTLRDLQTIGPAVFERFSATRDQTMENYRRLLKVYETAKADPRREPLVAELRATLDAMDEDRKAPARSLADSRMPTAAP